jgi:hypothetical protein
VKVPRRNSSIVGEAVNGPDAISNAEELSPDHAANFL